MVQIPLTQPKNRTSREEKLSVLSAILGPEAFAKLGARHPVEGTSQDALASEGSTQRAEWHRNRLLERFRTQSQSDALSDVADKRVESDQAGKARVIIPQARTTIDQQLSRLVSLSELSNEHPAVIARVVSRMPREDRVTTLKALPGPVARSVVKRLR